MADESSPKPRADRIGSDLMAESPPSGIRLDAGLRAAVDAERKREGGEISRSEWVRRAIYFRLAYLAVQRKDASEAETVLRRVIEGGES